MRGVKADPSSQLVTIRQHNDLVHQRQGSHLAHSERPVLGRGDVQETHDVL